jgi:hypothetical protein
VGPLREVFDQLLRSGPRPISLDEIGEAIGTRAVSTTEIEELLDALTQAGVVIDEPVVNLRSDLRDVLGAARTLRTELGRAPTTFEIAVQLGKPDSTVRAALLFGSILGR